MERWSASADIIFMVDGSRVVRNTLEFALFKILIKRLIDG